MPSPFPLSIPDVLSRRLGSVNGKHVDKGSEKPINSDSRMARVLLLKLCTWFVVLKCALSINEVVGRHVV